MTIKITRHYESAKLTHEIIRETEWTFEVEIHRSSGVQKVPVYVKIRRIDDLSDGHVTDFSYGPGGITYSVTLASKEEAEALDAAILANLEELGIKARKEP